MSKLTPIVVRVLADLESTVEAKVKAASTASAITAFIVTLLGSLTVFHGSAIPSVITGAIGALVTGGLTFLAGWLTRHTPRGTELAPTVNLAPLPGGDMTAVTGTTLEADLAAPIAPPANPTQ